MKETIINTVLLIAAAGMGYATYPLLHNQNDIDTLSELKPEPMVGSPAMAIKQVRPVKQPLARIDASVANQTANKTVGDETHGALSVPASVLSQQTVLPAKDETKKAAFNQAMQIVNQMIADRHISQDQLMHAAILLQNTGQENRRIELGSRILIAIERGEITQQQAGVILSPASPAVVDPPQ